MTEEEFHVIDCQVLDSVIDGFTLTVYFLGGESTEEIVSGGRDPGMFDVVLTLAEEGLAFLLRQYFVEWSDDSDPMEVIVWENGSAQITNLIDGKTIKALFPV